MKYVLITLIAFAFIGCAPTYQTTKYTPLKGRYIEEPFVVYSDDSYERVWERAVDILAYMGFPVNTLDKDNGIIIFDRSSFLDSYTYENKEGRLINPDAMIVIPAQETGSYKRLEPSELTAVANIRIRPEGNKTRININLTRFDLKLYGTLYTSSTFYKDMRSTGILEQIIANSVR